MQDLTYEQFERRVWGARLYQYHVNGCGELGRIDDYEQLVEREWRKRLDILGYDISVDDIIVDEQHRLGRR